MLCQVIYFQLPVFKVLSLRMRIYPCRASLEGRDGVLWGKVIYEHNLKKWGLIGGRWKVVEGISYYFHARDIP